MKNDKYVVTLTQSIGEIGLSFLFNQDAFKFKEDINDDFSSNIQTEIKLQVHFDDFPEAKREEKIFDSESTWSLYRSQKKYFLYACSLELNFLPRKLLILESDFNSGDLFIKNGKIDQDIFPDPLGYPLNQILMIILLSRSKGALLHACGIYDGNFGYLFLGNSGHGKSTISKIWFENKSIVLNDDRIIIREKDRTFWIYGTPWHGDFTEWSLKGLPINKIFFLRHGERNSIAPIKGTDAVSMILTRSFPPLWDQNGMDYTLGLFDRMASTLPCYELHFLPDKNIIDFVRNI
ncbi:MAG: hypothetical protein WCH07_09445 [Deltaproteobacteria bacterium]